MRLLRGCATVLLTAGLVAIGAGLFFDGRFDVPILWVRDVLAAGELTSCTNPLADVLADEPETPVATPTMPTEGDAGLWYDGLTDHQQMVYGTFLQALRDRQERFVLEDCTTSDAEAAYWAVRGDHPELFWLGGYDYGEQDGSVLVVPQFTVPSEQIDGLQAQIDEQVGEALAGIAPDASAYERLRHCYEWIVDRTDYHEGERDQTIVGVFVDHEAVCAGYARALQYLLAKQGIPCTYVRGEAQGRGSHGWNLVWLDGTPTYVDVTWGDPAFVGDDGTILPGDVVVHDYLCITTDEIMRDHTAIEPTNLPACTSTAYDYYRLEGTYLDGFSALALRDLIGQASERGETTLRFKLSSQEAYDEAFAFVSSQEVFRCFDEPVDGVTIANQDELRIIAIDWAPEELG